MKPKRQLIYALTAAIPILLGALGASAQNVRLNELVAENTSWTNFAGRLSDWVELHNPGEADVDLSDMGLSDQQAVPRRWVFPNGVQLPAHGFLVVFCEGNEPASTNAGGPLNTGFGLKSSGGRLYLWQAGPGAPLADAVVYGMQLPDLGIGRIAPDAEWQLVKPTPGAANEAVPLGNSSRLRFNEWMASPASGDDWFEIYNPEEFPVAIGGFYLTDTLANQTQYHIPELSFIGTEASAYALFHADNSPNKGADHTNFKLNSGGEALGLFDTNGVTVIDSVVFGPQLPGVSEGRFPDGSDHIGRLVDNPTPGRGNFYPLNGVVISEILSHADDPFEDAIELFNPTAGSIDISGWYVSDNIHRPKKYRIRPGTVIEAGGYQVIYRYQFQPRPGVSPSFGFSSAHGDELYLFTADATGEITGYRTGVVFPPAPNNIPFARYLASTGPQFVLVERVQMGTSVQSSDPVDLLPLFRTGRGAANAPPVVGPLVISEILYHPPDIGTNDNSIDEFVELRNIVSTNVPLFDPVYPSNHWNLRGAVDFTFTNDVWLEAGASLLVVNFDPVTNTTQLAAFLEKYQVPPGTALYGPYHGKLDNSGETLELYRPDIPQFCFDPDFGWVPPILVDRIAYTDSEPWPAAADGTGLSLQRRDDAAFGNDPVNWYAGTPTAGSSNGPPAGPLPHLAPWDPVQTVNAGGDFTLLADSGEEPNVFIWTFNGVPNPVTLSPSITIREAAPTNSGTYRVLVSNPYGAVEASCRVEVLAPPRLTSQPLDQAVPQGGTAIFLVTLEGTPPFSYQWRDQGGDLPGATNATLILSNVQPSQAGPYSVAVSTPAGDVTSGSATLSLTSNVPPAFVVAPRGAYFRTVTPIAEGTAFTFSSVVSGDPPISYQWIKDGIEMLDATNASLTIENYHSLDSGAYVLEARNTQGTVQSEPVALTLLLPPTVSILGPSSITLNDSTDIILQAAATGTERLFYQWQVDGRDLIGELCAQLVVPQATFTNAGNYRVIVWGPGGRVTSAPVEVNIRPRIVEIAPVGSQLQVKFDGTPDRTYHLQRSTDLLNWEPVATMLKGPGAIAIAQPDPSPTPLYFRVEQAH